MARLHIPLLFCIVLLASATEAAAGTVDERGSSTAVSGVYSVTFNLNVLSTLPAGSMITCRAQIAPNQGGLELRNRQLSAAPAAAAGRAAVTGPKVICATEIPFAWTVTGARGGVTLRYEIEAVSSSGSAPLLVRSGALQNVSAALPASGASAKVSLNMGI